MSRTSIILGDPGRIAPSVDKGWRDDFIVELRLLDVPGERIGDALMTVESHVVESGEPPSEAFGEPRAYAREIAEATGGAGPGIGPLTVASSVLGLIGMLVTARAFGGWLEGGPVGITAGELAGLVVLLVLASTLFFPRTLRLVVEHPWRVALVPALLMGVSVGLLVLFAEPLLTVPAAALGAVGAALLCIGAAMSWWDASPDADRIIAPGQPSSSGRGARVVAALPLPLMTLLLLAFIWVLHLLTP